MQCVYQDIIYEKVSLVPSSFFLTILLMFLDQEEIQYAIFQAALFFCYLSVSFSV